MVVIITITIITIIITIRIRDELPDGLPLDVASDLWFLRREENGEENGSSQRPLKQSFSESCSCWFSTWRAGWWASQANKAWLSSAPGRNLITVVTLVMMVVVVTTMVFLWQGGSFVGLLLRLVPRFTFDTALQHRLLRNATLAKGKCNALPRIKSLGVRATVDPIPTEDHLIG